MMSNAGLMSLLNDIKEFSEENDFSEASILTAKTRAAIKEDFEPQKNTATTCGILKWCASIKGPIEPVPKDFKVSVVI